MLLGGNTVSCQISEIYVQTVQSQKGGQYWNQYSFVGIAIWTIRKQATMWQPGTLDESLYETGDSQQINRQNVYVCLEFTFKWDLKLIGCYYAAWFILGKL